MGNEAALAAITLGAKVIEKHITLNKNLIGPDHKASLDPKEFFKFIFSIRKLEKILGKEKKFLTLTEKKIKKIARKSIVAKNTCFGIKTSVVDVGGSTSNGSGALKLEVNMKNVTNRNAKSTIGVISNEGVDRGIFTFGITFYLYLYAFSLKSK